jgi:flagellar motor switch protein FliM
MPVTAPPVKTKQVHNCNFRLAGRLSNEDARAVIAIHEIFARHATEALEAYVGAGVEVKFGTLNQLAIKDYLAEIPELSYVVPFSSGLVAVEFGVDMVFPIVELLMGGAAEPQTASRDLSEIEEEVMHDVVRLIVRQAESVWAIPALTLNAEPRTKPSSMYQNFRPTEKLAILRFEITLGDAAGAFNLVLAKPLLDSLIKKMKEDQPQKKQKLRSFPSPPLRERILDCDTEVVTELTGLKVAVKDLVALQPGSVLKLRAPIRMAGSLTAGGRALFEAVPVRNGTQRAAQLGPRVSSTDWKGR